MKRLYILVALIVATISVSFIFQSFDVVLYWFQSQSCNKTVVLCQNAIRAIFIILKLLLAVGGGTLFGFVIITALETIMLSASLPEYCHLLLYFLQ